MKKILFLLIPFIFISGCNKEIEIVHNAVEPIIDVTSIYEGDNYRYVINVSDEAYVKYGFKKISFKEALKQNIVTIDDIIKRNPRVFKEEKYQKSNNIKILYRPDGIVDSLMETIIFYEDDEYKYSTEDHFINGCAAYVEYNDQHISFNDALEQNLISIDDLVNAGFSFKKERK